MQNTLFCYTVLMKNILMILLGLTVFCSLSSFGATNETEVFVIQTDKSNSVEVAKKIHNNSTRKLYHFVEEEHFNIPEKLYEGGYDAVRMIRYAQKRYYREHKKYTANIADLNLTFSKAEKQLFLQNTSRIYLESGFYYVLTDQLVAVYFEYPLNDAMIYHLDFRFDGTQQCIAVGERAKKTCENLGGKNPTVNERMHQWTVYDLPDTFL